jgi:hypothetical protein
MFLEQEKLKIKILKVITHQGGCGYELYASIQVLYVNYVSCVIIYCCSDNDQNTCISHNQSIFSHNLNCR